jgi:hypothetical protein
MGFAVYVLLAGIGATVAGLALQLISHALFSRYKRGDTKEVAGVVGFRVAAIWGIAVGLIFAASAAHLIEAKGGAEPSEQGQSDQSGAGLRSIALIFQSLKDPTRRAPSPPAEKLPGFGPGPAKFAW